MITYEKRTVEENIPISMTCDVCKKEYNNKTDAMEIQEFKCIQVNGGYGSVFGDGSVFELDICQHCLKKMLGEYMRPML